MFRADEMQDFSGHRDLAGGRIQKTPKNIVFSAFLSLNLKKKSPFRSIVEKTVPGWTGGLKGAGGCSSECCSVVGRVDERLAVEAEDHYI